MIESPRDLLIEAQKRHKDIHETIEMRKQTEEYWRTRIAQEIRETSINEYVPNEAVHRTIDKILKVVEQK
mgnify:CR=1 FL=1